MRLAFTTWFVQYVQSRPPGRERPVSALVPTAGFVQLSWPCRRGCGCTMRRGGCQSPVLWGEVTTPPCRLTMSHLWRRGCLVFVGKDPTASLGQQAFRKGSLVLLGMGIVKYSRCMQTTDRPMHTFDGDRLSIWVLSSLSWSRNEASDRSIAARLVMNRSSLGFCCTLWAEAGLVQLRGVPTWFLTTERSGVPACCIIITIVSVESNSKCATVLVGAKRQRVSNCRG